MESSPPKYFAEWLQASQCFTIQNPRTIAASSIFARFPANFDHGRNSWVTGIRPGEGRLPWPQIDCVFQTHL